MTAPELAPDPIRVVLDREIAIPADTTTGMGILVVQVPAGDWSIRAHLTVRNPTQYMLAATLRAFGTAGDFMAAREAVAPIVYPTGGVATMETAGDIHLSTSAQVAIYAHAFDPTGRPSTPSALLVASVDNPWTREPNATFIEALPIPGGPVGPPGDRGEQGEQGEQGPPGDRGAQGPPGLDGVEGPPGLDGVDGAEGPPGLDGAQGPPGLDGVDGEQGEQGEQGPVGPQGERGPEGPPGPPGPPGGGGSGTWPTVDDIRAELRLDPDPVEDELIERALDAAIDWVRSRVGDRWRLPSGAELVPPNGFRATVLEASRLYRRRDSLDGTIGWGAAGVVRVGPSDPDIEALLGSALDLPL